MTFSAWKTLSLEMDYFRSIDAFEKEHPDFTLCANARMVIKAAHEMPPLEGRRRFARVSRKDLGLSGDSSGVTYQGVVEAAIERGLLPCDAWDTLAIRGAYPNMEGNEVLFIGMEPVHIPGMTASLTLWNPAQNADQRFPDPGVHARSVFAPIGMVGDRWIFRLP